MTTPTVTEAKALAKANDTYHRVMNSEWRGDGNKIRLALDGLLTARETYDAVLNDDMHPSAAFGDLEGDEDAYDKALQKAAQDAAAWARELDRLVPVQAESEAAA